MSNDFQEAVEITLKNEGGLSIDKSDPGGITNYGVSLRFLQENGVDINGDGSINAKDILQLTEQDAISIYLDKFWNKFNLESIKNDELADKVFDLSVNMGGYQAIKMLQQAINFQLRFRIQTDGIIGKMTLNALNNVNIPALLTAYKALACNFYQNLVVKNYNLQKFLVGWLRRANQ